MSESQAPFVTLGRHLRYVREQAQQSLAETSGAVEIEERSLEQIEAGRERPAEEILLLLINHFGVQDREAMRLWELAGYDSETPEQLRSDSELPAGQKSVMLLLGLDMRTMYSDGLDITVTPGGLTLSFTQTGTDRNMPVARVGMSYEQAEQVLGTLQQALLRGKYLRGPKALPPSLD